MNIEDGDVRNLEDSEEHNKLKQYFNKFALHRVIDEPTFYHLRKK